MICYRDRAFCYRSATGHCISETCPRRVTHEDRKGAEKLGLPFSLIDFLSDDCGYIENPALASIREAVE